MKQLPTYSLLLPCYKEKNVVNNLIKSIDNLHYPKDRLKVFLLLDEDDQETFDAIEWMPKYMAAIRLPGPIHPKGKPYHLQNALINYVDTEYVCIFDAEDRPEPDQLIKAVWLFENSDNNLACLQAKLNYYNAKKNWLTKFFTVEYTLWFEKYVKNLAKSGFPVPLGGTSNHFKVDILKKIGGWDIWNVTEDCDLGIRFAIHGYQVGFLDSTTWEEAPSKIPVWIRQRTRWVKGYMVTWLVHMTNPYQTLRVLGLKNFFGFNLFILATPLVGLINPFLWLTTIIWYLYHPEIIREMYSDWQFYLGLFLMILGNLSMIITSTYSIFKIKQFRWLTGYAIITPIYWLLQSIATYRALYQLITKPHVWEKTSHGESNV